MVGMRRKPPSSYSDGPAAERLSRLLIATNPIAEGAFQSSQLTAAFDRLGERIVTGGAWRRGRVRPSRLTVAVSLAALALVATAVAIGGLITTHTGFFPKVAGTENDTSEFLRTDAPDFPPLVRKLVSNIEFPPGYNREAYVRRYLNEPIMHPQDGAPNTVQAAGVRANMAFWAVCAWRGYWLEVDAAADAAGEAAAVAGLQRIASSAALKKVDSFWPHYLALAEAEKNGDAAPPQDLPNFDSVSCAGLEHGVGTSR